MSIESLMDQVFRRWETLLAAWNFYLVVAFAIVALFLLSAGVRKERNAFRIVAVGWAAFAWTHLLGILYMLKQWAAVAGMLKAKLLLESGGSDAVERIAEAGIVESPEAVWVVPFHLLGDAFVLVAIRILSRPARTPQ